MAEGIGTEVNQRSPLLATLQLNTGSWNDIEYGQSYGYMRQAALGLPHTVAGATIIEATANDLLRLEFQGTGTTTLSEQIVADKAHMDIEYLGTSPNILRYHDSAGVHTVDYIQ